MTGIGVNNRSLVVSLLFYFIFLFFFQKLKSYYKAKYQDSYFEQKSFEIEVIDPSLKLGTFLGAFSCFSGTLSECF